MLIYFCLCFLWEFVRFQAVSDWVCARDIEFLSRKWTAFSEYSLSTGSPERVQWFINLRQMLLSIFGKYIYIVYAYRTLFKIMSREDDVRHFLKGGLSRSQSKGILVYSYRLWWVISTVLVSYSSRMSISMNPNLASRIKNSSMSRQANKI